MKVNFQAMPDALVSDLELEQHADYLASLNAVGGQSPWVSSRPPPPGYESYVCVDVIGRDFVWMNESFSKDKVTWYLWFESVFLVPKEMATFLTLRWS